MPNPKVLCLWGMAIGQELLDPLCKIADVEVLQPDHALLMHRIHEYEVYLATLHVRLDRAVIDRADRLKLVATPSTGMDHIDADACIQRGIKIINIKTEYELLDRITATAEMAWALLLSAVRKIPSASAAAEGGQWARDRFRGHQLAYKTLGILGVETRTQKGPM